MNKLQAHEKGLMQTDPLVQGVFSEQAKRQGSISSKKIFKIY